MALAILADHFGDNERALSRQSLCSPHAVATVTHQNHARGS
jgi:hypothetical protein